jgi:hypothetical protein
VGATAEGEGSFEVLRLFLMGRDLVLLSIVIALAPATIVQSTISEFTFDQIDSVTAKEELECTFCVEDGDCTDKLGDFINSSIRSL